MLTLANLSPDVVKKIGTYHWDRFIEKHEGPETWASTLTFYDPEFMVVNGYDVLLPVSQKHHAHITVIRCIVGDNGQVLTIFLKDTTYVHYPAEEQFAGFVAICDRIAGETFFIAIFYHEWFITTV